MFVHRVSVWEVFALADDLYMAALVGGSVYEQGYRSEKLLPIYMVVPNIMISSFVHFQHQGSVNVFR